MFLDIHSGLYTVQEPAYLGKMTLASVWYQNFSISQILILGGYHKTIKSLQTQVITW